MKRLLFFAIVLAFFFNANSQTSGRVIDWEVKNSNQIPRYNSLANATITGAKPGSLVYVYATADSGLWVRNFANTAWKSVTGGGSAGWGLTGNAGTNPSLNFIGTTDNQDLIFKRNGRIVANFTENNVSLFEYEDTSWTVRTASETIVWGAVTYGNGLFVSVGQTGSNRVMTSPNGVTWTSRTAAELNEWTSIAYGNGVFVAVSQNGTNRVMTSPDGVTWTSRSAAEANPWLSITYGNGVFVAVSTSGTNRVMTSPDGVTWTARSAANANSWRGISYGNGLFVAVSTNGTNRVMTSPDGVTWTARSASESSAWTSVAYGNGLWVSVATSGTNRIMTSPDGVTWTSRSSPETNTWWSVAYGNGLWVVVGIDGTNKTMTSRNGINWIPKPVSEVNSWVSVVYANKLFVAVSASGTNLVMTLPAYNIVQSVSIGAVSANSTAILDLTTTNKGFLQPRMTAVQRIAIPAPAIALTVYDLDSARDMVNTPGGWKGVRYTSDPIPLSIDTITSTLGGNVTLTVASTWYDIGSVTLPSGTWVLMGQASYTGGAIYGARIFDGTTTFSSGNTLTPNIGSREASLFVYRIVSPTTTTTYKLQGASTTAGALVTTTTTINALGNATHFSAIKIK